MLVFSSLLLVGLVYGVDFKQFTFRCDAESFVERVETYRDTCVRGLMFICSDGVKSDLFGEKVGEIKVMDTKDAHSVSYRFDKNGLHDLRIESGFIEESDKSVQVFSSLEDVLSGGLVVVTETKIAFEPFFGQAEIDNKLQKRFFWFFAMAIFTVATTGGDIALTAVFDKKRERAIEEAEERMRQFLAEQQRILNRKIIMSGYNIANYMASENSFLLPAQKWATRRVNRKYINGVAIENIVRHVPVGYRAITVTPYSERYRNWDTRTPTSPDSTKKLYSGNNNLLGSLGG